MPNDRFWQSLPIRDDRMPNELNDVMQLWRALSDPDHPMNQSAPTFFKTKYGNINEDGDPTSFSSPILGMRNSRLNAALEPNIAPLVNLIKGLGFVTYSSCEGHLIDNSFYEAYTGVLFEESKQLDAAALVQSAEESGFIVFRTWLFDTLYKNEHKTIEIYFPRDRSMDVVTYHESLNLKIQHLKTLISAHTS